MVSIPRIPIVLGAVPVYLLVDFITSVFTLALPILFEKVLMISKCFSADYSAYTAGHTFSPCYTERQRPQPGPKSMRVTGKSGLAI